MFTEITHSTNLWVYDSYVTNNEASNVVVMIQEGIYHYCYSKPGQVISYQPAIDHSFQEIN